MIGFRASDRTRLVGVLLDVARYDRDVAAGGVRPPLDGVLGLSAPGNERARFETVAAVRRANVPFLSVAARQERDFASAARLLHARR